MIQYIDYTRNINEIFASVSGSDNALVVWTPPQQRRETRIEKPRHYNVVFHNDDYTTKQFVELVLIAYFNKNQIDAKSLMLEVHQKGKTIAGTFPKDIAEEKAGLVTDQAKRREYPFMVTVEPS